FHYKYGLMTSLLEPPPRTCLGHGFIFRSAALWLRIATAGLPHPRPSMSAHLPSFFTCPLLVAIGLAWREPPPTGRPAPAALGAGESRVWRLSSEAPKPADPSS